MAEPAAIAAGRLEVFNSHFAVTSVLGVLEAVPRSDDAGCSAPEPPATRRAASDLYASRGGPALVGPRMASAAARGPWDARNNGSADKPHGVLALGTTRTSSMPCRASGSCSSRCASGTYPSLRPRGL